MACGDNTPQQTNTMPQQIATTNGQPPMSMATGGTNVAPNASNFMNVAPYQMPTQQQMGSSPNTQQMAQQAAAMPTASAAIPQGSGDGIVGGKYDPTQDAQLQQMIGRMNAMRNSGAFLTPDQRAAQAHPFLSKLSNVATAVGQGLTHQPFYTSNQENETALQNTQAQGANALMTPQNMVNMAMLQQLKGSIAPQQTGVGNKTPMSPQQIQALQARAPKGSTGFSPSIGYHDAQGNPLGWGNT